MSLKSERQLLAAAQAFGDASKLQQDALAAYIQGDERSTLDRVFALRRETEALLISSAKAYATATRRKRKVA